VRRPAAVAVALAALAALAVGASRARAVAQAVEVKVPATRVCLRELNAIKLGVRSNAGPRRFRVRLYNPHGKVVLDHRGLATSRWKLWGYRPGYAKRTPYVGKLINKYVYEQLPPGVLPQLRRLNPVTERGFRRHKHFQFLTADPATSIWTDRSPSSRRS